jgi:Uma2 family endonuclease
MATVSFSTAGAPGIELPLRQFDADEYMAMSNAGVFEARKRVELIGGYVVDMSPANPDHNYVVMRFPRLFAALMAEFEFWIQGTLRVDRKDVFDPDFMLLLPREQSYKHALPSPPDVALLVEVAGSSLGHDAKVKLPIYAENGIADYWIADLDRDALIVHRQPSGKAYGDVKEYSGEATISPLAAPNFSVTVRDIFA